MKTTKRLLAMILIASLCAGTVNMPVFAEENVLEEEIVEGEVTETDTLDNEDGTTTDLTTTTTTEIDENGNLTVTVNIEQKTEGTNKAGAEVEGSGSSTEVTVTDAKGKVVEESSTSESTTTTTETTVDEESGETTVTETKKETFDETTAEGATTDYDQTTVTTTTTDENGEEIGSSWVVDGTEKKEWDEKDTGDEPGQPEVEVPLIPGETTTGTATKTEVTGEINSEEGQTTTTTTEREVSATTSEVTVETKQGKVDLTPVAPEFREITDGVESGYYKDGTTRKDDIIPFENDIAGYGDIEWNAEKKKWENVNWSDIGDYRYVGWGEESAIKIKEMEYVTYETDENGNVITDENGNAIIKSYYEDSTYPIQFVLSDEDGNLVYGYCVDLETGAYTGTYYNVDNLDDSNYYATDDAKDHIRAIVTNGYWGTGNAVDENGNYQTGSIAKIRNDVANALKDTSDDVEIELENGEKVKLSALMNDLTEGEALSATQAAIWTYANGNANILDGTANAVVVGENGFLGYNGSKLTEAQSARVNALYKYLINLSSEEKDETVVIDKDSVTNMSITVGDKVAEVEDTDDEGNEVVNGVYDVAMNFTLSFIPGEKDDLLVKLEYTDLEGNPVTVVKRLAGENEEGTEYDTIERADDGSYTISGLKLSENKDFNFDLRLEGTQYLEQGVYVYSPVGGRDTSQTFVGMAEGEREVDVSASMTVSFSVDENNHVVAERVWHDESDPEIEPDDPTPDPEPEDPKPEPKKPEPKPEDPKPEPKKPEPKGKKYSFKVTIETEPEETEPDVEPIDVEDEEPEVVVTINDEDIPLTDIPDEPIPLTGDSFVWYICSALAGIGLVAVSFFDRKKKNNA